MTQHCVVHLAKPVTDVARWEFLLDAGERERLDRFRLDVDKARFATGRAMAKTALAARLGIDPAEVRFSFTCASCGGPHGKPAVDGVEFTIAHSGQLVAVAVSESAPVGIDVELVNQRTDVNSMAETVLSPGEQDDLTRVPDAELRASFFTYWARKEALVKSTGMGLSTELKSVAVSAPRTPPRVTEWREGPADVSLSDLDLSPYTATEDYRGALAVLTTDDVAIDYQHFAG